MLVTASISIQRAYDPNTVLELYFRWSEGRCPVSRDRQGKAHEAWEGLQIVSSNVNHLTIKASKIRQHVEGNDLTSTDPVC